jgi:hypothetical protein
MEVMVDTSRTTGETHLGPGVAAGNVYRPTFQTHNGKALDI